MMRDGVINVRVRLLSAGLTCEAPAGFLGTVPVATVRARRSAGGYDAVLIVGLLLDHDLVAWLEVMVGEELPDAATGTPEVVVRSAGDIGHHRVGKTVEMHRQLVTFPFMGVG